MFIVESIISVTYSFECSRTRRSATIYSCKSPGILWCHILITVSQNAIVLDNSQPSGISTFQLENFQNSFLTLFVGLTRIREKYLIGREFSGSNIFTKDSWAKILTEDFQPGFNHTMNIDDLNCQNRNHFYSFACLVIRLKLYALLKFSFYSLL